MKEGYVLQGVLPVGVRKISISEHCPYMLEKHTVHVFHNIIMLGHVCSGYLVLDPLILKDITCYILAPSIRSQDLQAFSHLEFSLRDKYSKVPSHFQLFLHPSDEDLARVVIYPGDEVLKSLVRASGEFSTDIRENAA